MTIYKQTTLYLNQFKQRYPRAFKLNFLFYGQIKTKGILDEIKECIPWILAITIFGSLAYSIAQFIATSFPKYDGFMAYAIGILVIMLGFMLYCPIVIKQIKHSSTSLYHQVENTPLKLTALIILQGLNIAFAESWFLQSVLFFFAMGFGFVKLYKENMFKASVSHEQYFQLQQIRKLCYWSYKQILKHNFRLLITSKNNQKYAHLEHERQKFIDLHIELITLENRLCLTYKHSDMETYLDSLM